MAQENSNTVTAKLAADYDAVVAQLTALRADMARLANTVSSATKDGSQHFAQDVADGLDQASTFLGRKTKDADVRIETAIAANPYVALGIAAGVGLLLGVLTRR